MACCCLAGYCAKAQSGSEFGILAGFSGYTGDLQTQTVDFRQVHPAIGFLYRRQLYHGLGLRLGMNFGKISGDDRYAKDTVQRMRNLNFQSQILDVDLMLEYYVLDISRYRFSPYLFAGLAYYHFNPYSYDTSGNQVYLQPLGTEGEGLSAYPDKKMYHLNQLSIPFGLGVKYAITRTLYLGAEIGIRKTFTDYLDDVSGSYADQTKLQAGRGAQSVFFAYRTNQLPQYSSLSYPAEGTVRGTSPQKDWYFFSGLTLSFHFGGSSATTPGSQKALSETRCPF